MICKKSCQGISYNDYYANKRYECQRPCTRPYPPCPTSYPPCPTSYTPCAPYCNPLCDILIGQQKNCPVSTPCHSKPVCDILRSNEPKICPIQTPCEGTPVCDILADRCEC